MANWAQMLFPEPVKCVIEDVSDIWFDSVWFIRPTVEVDGVDVLDRHLAPTRMRPRLTLAPSLKPKKRETTVGDGRFSFSGTFRELVKPLDDDGDSPGTNEQASEGVAL